jgi:hypothetical protein
VKRFGAVLAVLSVLTGLATATAAPASAGVLGSCPDRPMSRPFFRWLDPLSYTLAPNGGLENGSTGWQLRNGAKVVAGNESFNLSGTGRSSLYLPTGSSATSPATCVQTLDVFARFVAKNRGIVLLSTLKVDAIVQDSGGHTFVLPAGVNTGGSSWAPSLPGVALLNLLGALNDGRVTVAFRFTPIGLGAAWQIDDLYVDPLKMG